MTTAIVIDPALFGHGDPHHVAAVGWVDAAHCSGLEVRVLGGRSSAPHAIDVFPIEQAFDRGPDAFSKDAPRQAHLRAARRAVRDALARALADTGPDDILILSHAQLPDLDGLTAWASAYTRDELPRLIVWISQAPLDDPFVKALGSTAPLVAAFDRLRAQFGERAVFLGSSEDLVERYHAFSCGRLGCLPVAALCQRDAAPDADVLRALRLQVLQPLLAAELASEMPPAAPEPKLPGVDIVVALHNYARFIKGCLASVASQTYPNWRCIVVDDGSTDITLEELRTLVASFGPRFSLAPHLEAEGHTQAVATGLSLSANPFVVMLDADDRLEPVALDQHISWHLNARVPVALTSGQMRVVDAQNRLLSGALDFVVNLRVMDRLHPLPATDAFRRPEAGFERRPALFADRNRWFAGEWFWAPTSGLMLRRSLMELILPQDVGIVFFADTYFALGLHAFGSSILIDATVARYTRHGGNAYADAPVYGAGTLALANAESSDWARVAPVLRHQIERHRARFDDQINAHLVAQVLTLLNTDLSAAEVPALTAPPPLPFVVRVIHSLHRKGRRLRNLARRIGLP